MMADYDQQMRLATENPQIRIAAESILNASVNSQRSSYTQSVRTPDTINEVLIAGSRHNGRMSNVRRFFCLFVTFDFLFTVLMWLICIMISGANVRDAFVQQIVHYQIKSSLFDIVMAAACRFTVLLLFYALLYMDHWCIVAISTSLTCAFLLSKVFLYDWLITSQPVFQVLLILTSFVLVWGEVWFLDIKVIPQESQARDWFSGFPGGERAPLLSPTLAVPTFGVENAGHFYTPMDSPDNSDDEDEELDRKRGDAPFLPATISLKLPQEKIDEYRNVATNLLKKCHDLIISDNWKRVKDTPEGDGIDFMVLPKPDGKIFKITGIIDVSAERLINSLHENVESSFQWNKQVGESKKICTIDENTDIVYQATKALGNGTIGARDFVVLRHRGQYDPYFITSGISVSISAVPCRKNFVRAENGVGCFAARSLEYASKDECMFVWLLNTNLKGWIPQKVIDMSMSVGLSHFMTALRSHVHTIKD